MMTFSELCRSCPTIAELKADAASIANNERWPWYDRWIAGSRIFHSAIHAAAVALDVPEAAIRREVLTGLLDVYDSARRRRAKREAAA